jgi:hypothetical protein
LFSDLIDFFEAAKAKPLLVVVFGRLNSHHYQMQPQFAGMLKGRNMPVSEVMESKPQV